MTDPTTDQSIANITDQRVETALANVKANAARGWEVPAEPGADVTAGLPAQKCGHCHGTGYLAEPANHITAVIDRHGDRWERAPGHWQWHLARPPHSAGPWYSLRNRAPLTDATSALGAQTGTTT